MASIPVLADQGLIGNIYNLTVAAWQNGQTEDEEHRWFESQLPPWDKETILLSILPSRLKTAYRERWRNADPDLRDSKSR